MLSVGLFLQHPYLGSTEQGVDTAERQPSSSPYFQEGRIHIQGYCLPDMENLVPGRHMQIYF